MFAPFSLPRCGTGQTFTKIPTKKAPVGCTESILVYFRAGSVKTIFNNVQQNCFTLEKEVPGLQVYLSVAAKLARLSTNTSLNRSSIKTIKTWKNNLVL